MVQFYLTLLGATLVHTSPILSFLRYDHEHHRIAIICPPNQPSSPSSSTSPPRMTGLDHIAFSYDTLPDLARSYIARKEAGLLPIWSVNHGPTTSMYYRDPDGNKIEMQVDNFEDPAEADEFMKGKFFEENPIGTDLDAEGWAEKVLRTERNENEKSKEKVWKEMRQREEIGGRMGLPEGF
jgi:catechol 2,3-dioxygenase-like lactoylglutathione lyase family enzyme